jgi:NADH dehydrogenase (ubiquinone) 1 alpha/beta subcomplex 1
MSSLSALRNGARSFVNAAVRMAPRASASAAPLRVAPALWSRSFASGGFLPKEEVSARVLDVVKNFQNVDPAKVTPTSHFINDLGLDSLDTVEVCSASAPGSQRRAGRGPPRSVAVPCVVGRPSPCLLIACMLACLACSAPCSHRTRPRFPGGERGTAAM